MSAVLFHVDLDAFFASVERLDDPSLAGKPVIVGAAPGRRGVVCTCSYEAREFGVHSAMPISEAYRRCPQGVFLPVRMRRYVELSGRVMEIFSRFTPDVRPMSIDEAFLDMTGTRRLWGPPAEAAVKLKTCVFEETGLTISVGVAHNAYAAKIASGLRKPDGLYVVEEGQEEEFALSLPLSKLWGAGEKTQERFRQLGIVSVAQLASLGEAQIASLFGNAAGRFLHAAAHGRDPGILGPDSGRRSLSAETTFERDTAHRETILDVLMGLAEEISFRLWDSDYRSRTLALKLRFDDFSTISRRATRPAPYLSSAEVFGDAVEILDRAWDGRRKVRLLGLGFGDLTARTDGAQGELFADGSEKIRRAESAAFEIERDGKGRLTRARLLGKEGLDRRRPGGDAGIR
ncbi:MAG: DNA polymerase IV [Treponema sp.]|nr:DNA polymerase IV [Treponema sp.]